MAQLVLTSNLSRSQLACAFDHLVLLSMLSPYIWSIIYLLSLLERDHRVNLHFRYPKTLEALRWGPGYPGPWFGGGSGGGGGNGGSSLGGLFLFSLLVFFDYLKELEGDDSFDDRGRMY